MLGCLWGPTGTEVRGHCPGPELSRSLARAAPGSGSTASPQDRNQHHLLDDGGKIFVKGTGVPHGTLGQASQGAGVKEMLLPRVVSVGGGAT